MNCSLNKFYRATGTSKQAFHDKLNRYLRREEYAGQLHLIVKDVRADHPGMSLRDLYHLIKPRDVGRDWFESYFSDLGYAVGRRKSYHKTTDSRGVTRFDNLIADKKLTGVNQVWVSDITYYRIDEKFYYITFIMDLHSRRIVGHSVSNTLLTQHTTIPALKRGLKTREAIEIEGLIIHSDGGGQYYSKEFRKITEAAKMINSMGVSVFENPHAERVNGIIKNNYLHYYSPKTFKQLKKMTEKAVKMYNYQKPHRALRKMNPVEFENQMINNYI